MSKNSVLLPQREVTARYIREIKQKYGLSWSELHEVCGYDVKGNALIHAVSNPERYLTKLMQKKILRGVAKLEKERGHTYEVIWMIKRIPSLFRIAGEPRRCLGHNQPTFELPKDGFCNTECRELYNAKRARIEKRK